MDKPAALDGGAWMQPESAVNVEKQAQFPFTQIFQSESGHSIEFDDTKGRERVRIHHRMGTFIEMNPDGSIVHRVNDTSTEVVIKDKNIKINGDCSITVMGNAFTAIHGNRYEHVYGDYLLSVDGIYNCLVKGKTQILSDGDFKLGAGGPLLTGKIHLVASDNVYTTSDIITEGEIIAFKMTSKTRIDAGLGMHAGPFGFVTPTGGVSVGLPLPAPPGFVNAALVINAGLRMTSPFATFGIMNAYLMTDAVNTKIYDWHIHITPHGISSFPIIPMVGI